MTQTATSGAGGEDSGATRARAKRPGPFSSLGLFLRQVVAELSKVATPTRKELLTYFAVVLIFVLAVMLYVFGLDYGFGKFVFWLFTDSGT